MSVLSLYSSGSLRTVIPQNNSPLKAVSLPAGRCPDLFLSHLNSEFLLLSPLNNQSPAIRLQQLFQLFNSLLELLTRIGISDQHSPRRHLDHDSVRVYVG